MIDWDLIEADLLGADDSEMEEIERNMPCDGPVVRAFYGLNKSKKERIVDVLKKIPLLYAVLLICPFWLLYEEVILPIIWYFAE